LREIVKAASIGAMVDALGTYETTIGSQTRALPIVPLSDELAIALLITVDHGVAFSEQAGKDLAQLLGPLEVDIVVSVATMGIPLAIETSRALHLDDYVILQKTPKIHLADAISEPVTSITTDARQRLLFDRARTAAVTDKRVALIDDVVSTGASVRAALNLVRRVGGEPVAVGALLTEGATWRATLGEDASLVRALGSVPLFRREPDGSLKQDWQG
jgi:adenine/guanine phosphoribosyltransferase-like PRPP-binding protein